MKRRARGHDFCDYRRRTDRRGNGGSDRGDRSLHFGEEIFGTSIRRSARVILIEGEPRVLAVISRRFAAKRDETACRSWRGSSHRRARHDLTEDGS